MVHSDMASPHDLEPVCDASGPGEAHIIASMLREQGIEAFVFDTAATTLQWDAPRIINPYMVHVQRADLEEARRLIASNREASVDLDWDEVDVGEPEGEKAAITGDRDDYEARFTKGLITPANFFILVLVAIVFSIIASLLRAIGVI